ncbi:putative replication endonuclease from prophage-like region domain protein [Shigella flexneri CCH060]|uniref:Putative replication endonuclease from prophage-like region domain protein n=1 Tax=Shigella flexneri CCH060 TaxID=754091 RepID=A0A6N3R0X2_SHIFL|nr:putative replication endonuclease from prophage-like region domain protein [Shigella flexneri CCH060]EJZ67907.1 putative replication endonuclease from prophage-like region domain protein [Shigella flexneri 1485-80]
MSHADMNNCCGFNEAAAAFSWNSPKKAINPYLDPAEVAPVSALSNLITLYAADNEQEQLRREALSDQVWERYFFMNHVILSSTKWSRISSLAGQSWRMSSSVLIRIWSFWRTSTPSLPISASR